MIQEMKIPINIAFKYKIKKLVAEEGYHGDNILKIFFENKNEEDYFIETLRGLSFEVKRIFDKPSYVVVIFKKEKEYSLK